MRDATRKQLADYKAVFSHTNIPQNDPEYEQLRNWVNNQKSQYIVQWFNQFISANVLLVGGSALIIRFSVDLKDQGRIIAHLQEILLKNTFNKKTYLVYWLQTGSEKTTKSVPQERFLRSAQYS